MDQQDEIKIKGGELKARMCKECIDQLIAELDKIPDQVLLDAVRPHIKLKIKLV